MTALFWEPVEIATQHRVLELRHAMHSRLCLQVWSIMSLAAMGGTPQAQWTQTLCQAALATACSTSSKFVKGTSGGALDSLH